MVPGSRARSPAIAGQMATEWHWASRPLREFKSPLRHNRCRTRLPQSHFGHGDAERRCSNDVHLHLGSKLGCRWTGMCGAIASIEDPLGWTVLEETSEIELEEGK